MPKTTQPTRRRRLLKLALPAALALASLSLLAGSAFPKADPDPGGPQVAKQKTKKQRKISGRLTQGGYTVIALAQNGKAKTDRAPKGTFKLRPPAKHVTLHLRASDGTYAGPIVAGTRKGGKRVIVGVNAGARLGKVKVNSDKGFAKVKGHLRKKWINATRKARAKKGVPIGAGNFGRVKSKKTHGGAPGDLDLDGIADPLDIDDDGDKVLDNLDPKPRKGSKARASGGTLAGGFSLASRLHAAGPDKEPVNANAPNMSDARIEAALPSYGLLGMSTEGPGGNDAGDTELDCGKPQDSADPGLIYCTKGGTGRLHDAGAQGDPFPECCDPDGDNLGALPFPGGGLYHGATSDQIKSGDVLIQRFAGSDGSPQELVSTLQYVFATTPALVSYDDGQGNSRTLSYLPGDPLDFSFPVTAGPSGDVVVELTFWRPQRRAIPPEKDEWIDMGGLSYFVAALHEGGFCAQHSYSTSDPNLVPQEFSGDYGSGGGYRDLADDLPAKPDNTIIFKINLSECFAPRDFTFEKPAQIELGATPTALAGDDLNDFTSERGLNFYPAP